MVSGKTRSTIAMLALVAAGPADALGFGDVRAQVLLGQPLNLAVPVSLGEAETLSAECAAAEIQIGESRLQPGMVRVRVTQGRDNSEAVIRIQSNAVVDEPVVNVTVSAGCPPRITRTLVLLADPPLVSTASVEPPRALAADPAPPRNGGAAAAATAPTLGAPSAQAPAPRATRPATPTRATRTAAPRRASEAATGGAAPRTARSAAATAPTRTPERSGRPRLQLDAPTLAVAPAAVQAAEAQASAAEAQASAARLAAATAEAAASAAQQRLKEVETEMARLRAEAQAQTEALVQLRQQIAQDQAQRQQQSSWVNPLLLAATVLMAVLALWIALRSRRQEPPPAQREVWWDKAGGVSEPPALDPDEDSTYRPSTFKPSARVPLKMPSAPAPLGARDGPPTNIGLDSLIAPPTVAAPMAVTIPPMPPQRGDDASRAVSVDEQIDLEQQADFFIALGHDESAVDLLMAHLRSTGGGTPLPFLKLLEIHRRRGDREAYERTRVRFNQRFNSVAPEWNSDPGVGRSLEDYPLVVGRIQHAWPRPLDAMAELEALLFRRGAGAELFDLPAYQEVLFLYQLARDLHQADQPEEADNVDVLLPIGAAAVPAAEGTIVLRPEFNHGEAVSLDLDLTTKPSTMESSPSSGVELDLGGGERDDKPAAGGGDLWSEDPDERRRK